MEEKILFSLVDQKMKGMIIKPGDVLNGHYVIESFGNMFEKSGGIGIIYKAKDTEKDIPVVIKTLKSNEKELNRQFIANAKTLMDLISQNENLSFVRILDIFKSEDDIDFVVMEYLNGITLENEIKEHGNWSAEKTFQMFLPILNSLEKLHNTGYIHGDISPDNLMLLEEDDTQRLVLVDFDSLINLNNNEFIKRKFKPNYSPREIRDTYGIPGFYSDVYSLCATMYYCITRRVPDDSKMLSINNLNNQINKKRFPFLFHKQKKDEVLAPSEIGLKGESLSINKKAEKSLMRGLIQDYKQRTQSIPELRTELKLAYPNRTHAEILRHTILNTLIYISITVIVLAILYSFRINIRFHFMDTQTVWLDTSELPSEHYLENVQRVRERVEAFAGKDNYLWNESDGLVHFEVPSVLFGKTDPQDLARMTLTRPIALSIRIQNSDGDWRNFGNITQSQDISAFTESEGGIVITFSNAASERFAGLLSEPGLPIRILIDEDLPSLLIGEYKGVTQGDGRSMLLYESDSNTIPISKELEKLHWTEDPISSPIYVWSEWKVSWENPSNAILPGKYQLNQGEIPGNTITVKYKRNNPFTGYGIDAAMMSFQAVVKNRLDAMGIPYAIGFDFYNPENFVIKAPTAYLWAEELYSMGKSISSSISLGSRFAPDITRWVHPKNIKPIEKEEGLYYLCAEYSKFDIDDVTSILQTLLNQNEKEIYLYYDQLPLAACPINDALDTIQNKGIILFDHWTLENYKDLNDNTLHFMNFLSSGLEQVPQDSFFLQDVVEYRDEKGKIQVFEDEITLPESITYNSRIESLIQNWRKEYSDIFNIAQSSEPYERNLTICYLPADNDNLNVGFEAFENFYNNNQTELESGMFQQITLILANNGERYNESGDLDWDKLIYLQFDMDFETSSMKLHDNPFGLIGATKELKEIINNQISSDPFWKKFQ